MEAQEARAHHTAISRRDVAAKKRWIFVPLHVSLMPIPYHDWRSRLVVSITGALPHIPTVLAAPAI